MPTLEDIAKFRESTPEPTTQLVSQILPHVRKAIEAGKDLLIANALVSNIDGDGSIRRNRRVVLWDSGDNPSDRLRDIPQNVGVVLTMRWISHTQHGHLNRQAKQRGVFMTPKHLTTGEVKQVLRFAFGELAGHKPREAPAPTVVAPAQLAAALQVAPPDQPIVVTPTPAPLDPEVEALRATAVAGNWNLTDLITAAVNPEAFLTHQRAEGERLHALALQLGISSTSGVSVVNRVRDLRREGRLPQFPPPPQAAAPAPVETSATLTVAPEPIAPPAPAQPAEPAPSPEPATQIGETLEAALAALAAAEQAIASARRAVERAQVETEVAIVKAIEDRVVTAMAEAFDSIRRR